MSFFFLQVIKQLCYRLTFQLQNKYTFEINNQTFEIIDCYSYPISNNDTYSFDEPNFSI